MSVKSLYYSRSYGIMGQQNCGERSCAFPAVAGNTLCKYHIAMFAVEESPDEDESDHRFAELNKNREVRSAMFDGEISHRRGGAGSLEWQETRERKEYLKIVARLTKKKSLKKAIVEGRCTRCGRPRGNHAGTMCPKCSKKK